MRNKRWRLRGRGARCLLGAGWLWLFLCAGALRVQALRIEGGDWLACFSLPVTSAGTPLPDTFSVRDALIERLERLEGGDRAALATFTLSGASPETGMAGPLLLAVSNALRRGVQVHLAVGSRVKRAKEFGPGLSLARLSRMGTNPLVVSMSPRSSLMHHKAAIFDEGEEGVWSFVGSGNFTGASNLEQWNAAVLIRNRALHDALAAEIQEFREGRFSRRKQRGHDGTVFRLEDSWGDCWVRFGPFPRTPGGRVNAEVEIRRLIQGAEEEIYFAMHRFNRPPLRRALVEAANRGVRVRGVIPLSDQGMNPGAISGKTVRYFANPSNYTGSGRVELVPARVCASGEALDGGEPDLVHAKYMVVDPNGPRPVVVHGASNWTASGLILPDRNDESILFLRHQAIAQAFLEQFRRMTGLSAVEGEAPFGSPPGPGAGG